MLASHTWTQPRHYLTRHQPPIPRRRNVVVPSGTVGLLHKRVKLQQRRWHGAPVLTRFPAWAFFFPLHRHCGGRMSRHFTPRAVAILSGTSLFFQRPSPLLRFFKKTLPSWKSDVTRPRPRTVVAAVTCTEGLVGNLSTGRKGGGQMGAANTISPRWSVSPPVSFMTSCVSAESERRGDQTAFAAFP